MSEQEGRAEAFISLRAAAVAAADGGGDLF